MVNCLGCFGSLINKATVGVTHDYEQQKPLTQPKYCRAITRCLLTLILAGVVVAAIYFLVSNQSGTRLVQEEYAVASHRYPALPPGPLDGTQLIRVMNCPCFRQSFSWTRFIEFYVIYQDANGLQQEQLEFIQGNKLCALVDGERYVVCQNGLGAILPLDDMEEQRTSIETSSLLPPYRLYTRVLGQIDTNLQTEFNSYFVLQFNNEDLYTYSLFIMNLMYAMINQLKVNISSTKEDYWQASRATFSNVTRLTPSKLNFSIDYALGMSIDWDEYAAYCAPNTVASYCDVVYSNNTPFKVFQALSAVGGFLSIGLFIVRVFLWPVIAKVFYCGAMKHDNVDHAPTS